MTTTSTSTTNTTTQREPFEPVSDESRAVARAILSTLSPGAAACVLVALAGLARAIVDAFDIMREGGPMAEGLARQTLGAAVDAFDALSDGQRDAGVAAFAVSAAWWFSTPAEVCASFWRGEPARASVTSQSRGAAVEAAALRVMLASGALPTPSEKSSAPSCTATRWRFTASSRALGAHRRATDTHRGCSESSRSPRRARTAPARSERRAQTAGQREREGSVKAPMRQGPRPRAELHPRVTRATSTPRRSATAGAVRASE